MNEENKRSTHSLSLSLKRQILFPGLHVIGDKDFGEEWVEAPSLFRLNSEEVE
jgi:hypothetical protein